MSRVLAAMIAACSLIYLSSLGAADPAEGAAKADPLVGVLTGLHARSIGPANMGGRVTALAVVESQPDTFYVGAAGGGVWKTTDAGSTFTPIFDDQTTLDIGAIAVCQAKPNVIYVGTGEGNPRNSVSTGNGVYRSIDGGKTWKHLGLSETHHIGRLVVHPTDPNIAYVAALGHLWAPNRARGLFKTTDGGQTWDNVKFIDENTGFVEVIMDPSDADTLYAAAWQVRRDSYSGGSPRTQFGPTGGIFKTTDAGKTWEKLGGGLPEKAGYGRCGLSIYRKDPKVVYAIIHTSETDGQLTTAGQLPTDVNKDGKLAPVGNAEKGGIFRSDDGGKTWKKVNDLVPRPFYFGQIRVDPTDDQRVYVLGIPLRVSTDGCKTFTLIARTIHADHHVLWVNPANSNHVIVGNDGGLFVSQDRGRTWDAKRGLVISQYYGVAVDLRIPYHVYGGLQDNGSWDGPVATAYSDGVTLADWRKILGADGFQAATDPDDPNTVYVESQYGRPVRVNLVGPMGPTTKAIRPKDAPKDAPVHRYNWNAPILLSPHNSKTLYYGAQYLFKSTDRGDTWAKISPDLSAPPKTGNVLSYAHNILSTAESPVKQGELWVGTDDGRLWVSKDDGKKWNDVGVNLPGVPKTWAVPKIEPSHFEAGVAFVAIDRHRQDDFKPYIFKTTDHGATWKSIAGNLPAGAVVGVVRQSSKSKNLLFAGTEIGLFVTFDGGERWHHVSNSGMPKTVRVDDLVIHPRERELVIGTHGRGVWIMDIAPLEQLGEQVLIARAHLFDVKPITVLTPRKRAMPPPPGFLAPNPPQFQRPVVSFLIGSQGAEKVTLQCKVKDGMVTNEFLRLEPGLHFREFSQPLPPGEYELTFEAAGVKQMKKLVVKAERKPESKADE